MTAIGKTITKSVGFLIFMTLAGPFVFFIQRMNGAKYYTESGFYDAPWYNLINTTNYQSIHFLLILISILYPIYCGYKKPGTSVLVGLATGVLSVLVLSIYLHLDWFGNCSDFCGVFTMIFIGPIGFILSTVVGGIISRSTYSSANNSIEIKPNELELDQQNKEVVILKNTKKLNSRTLLYLLVLFIIIGTVSLGWFQNLVGIIAMLYLIITGIKEGNKKLLGIIVIGVITIVGIRMSLSNNPLIFQNIGNIVKINDPGTYLLDKEELDSPREIHIQIGNGTNPKIPEKSKEIDYEKQYRVKGIANIYRCNPGMWCDIIIQDIKDGKLYKARGDVIHGGEIQYQYIWGKLGVGNIFGYVLILVVSSIVLLGTMLPKKQVNNS